MQAIGIYRDMHGYMGMYGRYMGMHRVHKWHSGWLRGGFSTFPGVLTGSGPFWRSPWEGSHPWNQDSRTGRINAERFSLGFRV